MEKKINESSLSIQVKCENYVLRVLVMNLRRYLAISAFSKRERIDNRDVYEYAGKVFNITPKAVLKTFTEYKNIKKLDKSTCFHILKVKSPYMLTVAYHEKFVNYYIENMVKNPNPELNKVLEGIKFNEAKVLYSDDYAGAKKYKMRFTGGVTLSNDYHRIMKGDFSNNEE